MSRTAVISGGPLAHEWRSTKPQQRLVSMGLVIGLHVAVLGGFILASLKPPQDPPQPILQVSLISEASAAAAQASPAQPSEPTPAPPAPAARPPEPTLLSTPAPTASAMSAPPVERRPADPTPAAATAPAPASAPPASAPPASAGAPAASPGPVTPPNFRAAYLNNPGPVYPPSSRRKREEGVVRLRVQVSPEGAPNQVQLERSSGSADLDNAALDIVRKRWKFVPAQQAGKPVTAWVIVPLEFSLTR